MSILRILAADSFESILKKHSELFKKELDLVKEIKVKLDVDQYCQPRFFKLRSVPFALRQRVEAELQRLQKLGVIESVPFCPEQNTSATTASRLQQ